MMSRRRFRVLKAALLTFAVLGLSAGGLLYRNWSAVESYVEREYLRRQHAASLDGVARDLASGRFGPGSSVEELFAAHPPHRVTRAGRFVVASFPGASHPGSPSGGANVVAMDGRLVYASVSHFPPDRLKLFDTRTPADSAAMMATFTAYTSDVEVARMATAGAAGVLGQQGRLLTEP